MIVKTQFFLILVTLIFVGCGKGSKEEVIILDASLKDSSTIVRSAVFKSIEECETGGVEIDLGIDTNQNGVLDDEEVISTETICNGQSGFNSLVKISDEAVGDNCAAGGKIISLGVDLNRNVVLDVVEIQEEQYICHGIEGTNGTDGKDGAIGANAVCGVKDNLDGSKILSCNDGTSITINDGATGPAGGTSLSCSINDNGDGTKTISCEGGTSITVKYEEAVLAAHVSPIIFSGDTANLDASLSTAGGIDGEFVSFRWQQIPVDNSVKVTINNSTKENASFVAPVVTKNTVLGFKLSAITEKGTQQIINLYTMLKPYTGEHIRNISKDFPTRKLGHILGQASVNDVVVVGNIAYVADGVGLRLIDISDNKLPVVSGVIETPGQSKSIAIVGSMAYVADGDNGLQIIDVNNEQSPSLLGAIKTPAAANGIDVVGNVAYVAYSSMDLFTSRLVSGLQLVDISNTQSPKLLGDYRNSDTEVSGSENVSVVDTKAYLASGFGSLQVIDVSNVDSPVFVESINTPGRARDVVIINSVAYVADGSAGLHVIDLTNSQPAYSVTTPGTSQKVSVVGSIAYMADGRAGGLSVIDLNSKALSFNVDTPGSAVAVTFAGGVAYLADGSGGLQLFDVSNINSDPTLLSTVNIPDFSYDIAVFNNVVYVADGVDGFQIVDLSDVNNPVILSSINTPGRAISAAVKGTLAYVSYEDANNKSGLQKFDVSDPQSPQILRDLKSNDNSYAGRITLENSNAYIASGFSGVRVIDLVGSKAPYTINTPGRAMSVTVEDSVAYVADRENGLRVIDLNDLESAYSIETPGIIANDVVVVDAFAYVVDLNGLQVIDLNSNQLVHSIKTPSAAISLAIIDSIAYVAYDDNDEEFDKSGIQVIDTQGVSFGFAPVTLGNINKLPGVIQAIEIIGSTAYLAAGASGLQIIDLSDIQMPVNFNRVDTAGRAFSVKVVESVAYVDYLTLNGDGSRSHGLQLIDINDPQSPYVLSNINTPMKISSVDVVDSMAYVALGQVLQIIDTDNPQNPRTVRNIVTPGNVIDINEDPDSFTQGYITDISVVNNVAYVAYVADGPMGPDGSGGSGLQLIDVANVRNGQTPIVLSTFVIPGFGYARSLFINGSVAYVADQWGHLHLIDVSDNQTPIMIDTVDIPGEVNSVVVEGDIAYVTYATQFCCGEGGLESKLFMIDISNVHAPIILGSASLPGYVQSGVVVGNIAYIADGVDGLQLIDVSDTQTPHILNTGNGANFNAIDVTIVGDIALIANLEVGLTTSRLPVLANSYDYGISNTSLVYTVHFETLNRLLLPIGKCWVSGGSCQLDNIDSATNSVNFSWQLPDTGGDYEIVFGIGTKDFFFTNQDHVTVLSDALSETMMGIWQETVAHTVNSLLPKFIHIEETLKVTYYQSDSTECTSRPGELVDLTSNDFNQQVATDGDTMMVLSNNDELLVIDASSGAKTYTRVNAVDAACI